MTMSSNDASRHGSSIMIIAEVVNQLLKRYAADGETFKAYDDIQTFNKAR